MTYLGCDVKLLAIPLVSGCHATLLDGRKIQSLAASYVWVYLWVIPLASTKSDSILANNLGQHEKHLMLAHLVSICMEINGKQEQDGFTNSYVVYQRQPSKAVFFHSIGYSWYDPIQHVSSLICALI